MGKIKFVTKQLALSAKDVLELEGNYLAVPKRSRKGFYGALASVSDLLRKYEKLVLVFPAAGWCSQQILQDFVQYCQRNHYEYAVVKHASEETPGSGTAYVTLSDTDLAALIKVSRLLGYSMGKELGLLSLDDSRLKKLMGLTVVTLGSEAGNGEDLQCCQHALQSNHAPPMNIIRRGSL